MKIERLRVKNFKSYKKIDVPFENFNVIIGTNASGKSNFVSLFQFLKNIATESLEDAISLQGGINWVRNMNLSSKEHLQVELFFDTSQLPPVIEHRFDEPKKRVLRLKINNFRYFFELKFLIKEDDFRIVQEVMDLEVTLFEKNIGNGEVIENQIDKGKISLKGNFGTKNEFEFIVELDLEEKSLNDSELQRFLPKPPSLTERDSVQVYARDLPILRGFYPTPLVILPHIILRDIELFDIDPKLSKNSSAVAGKKKLEQDGRNLALVLKKALKNPKTRKTITNYINGLLPFVDGLEVEQISDRLLSLRLRESYCKKKLIPSTFVSDGTINLIALVVALVTGQKGRPPVLIEEPDRNLHPSLIGEFVEVLEDISVTNNRQLIITTHNPEIVKHLKLENILLISRKGRFSTISRPIKSEDVKMFIQKEMGLDQLFVKNLLE